MNTFFTAAVALMILVVTTCAYLNPNLIADLFGPPAVAMAEKHEPNPNGPRFDHAPFDALLREHVDQDGRVNYDALARDPSGLDRYINTIAQAPFDDMGRNEKLALLINAYNAFTLRLILDYHPLQSIKDIPSAKRWKHVRWRVGPHTLSLNQIEHQHIRPNFKEPRIHFALVCAAVGCPPLRSEAYQANRLEEQLEAQTRNVHRHDRWFRYDAQRNRLGLTSLYKWYGDDFKQAAGSAVRFAARYHPPLQKTIDTGGKLPKIQWLDYDWALNSQHD